MICHEEGCDSYTEGRTFFCASCNHKHRKKERDEAKEKHKREKAFRLSKERKKLVAEKNRSNATAGESVYCQKVRAGSTKKKSGRIKQYSESGRRVKEAEWKMFREIWNERPHYSEISGAFLGDEYNPSCFAHILSKGAYEGLRTYKPNICLMTPEEHHVFDHQTDKAKSDPKYAKVFRMKDELMEYYYQQV